MPLSLKQTQVFRFIERYIQSNHEAPTIAEIGRQFQMRSTASVHQVITVLEHEKLITRVSNISRGIRLVEKPLNPS